MFEPFNLAYTNKDWMSQWLIKDRRTGTLKPRQTRDELRKAIVKWNTANKKLTLLQRPRAEEDLLLLCYNYRPNSELLKDYLTVQWLKDYTLATCKFMLGEARSKFATIAGPQGGSQLNGDTLKQEAQAELEKLEAEVSTQITGGAGYSFVIG